MSAAITELSAARAARPAPDPLFWPAGEPAAGRPLLATPVPAGAPAPADDRVERRLSLDEHLVRAPERTFFARVQGDAWAALGVRDGDLLVVDRAGAVPKIYPYWHQAGFAERNPFPTAD